MINSKYHHLKYVVFKKILTCAFKNPRYDLPVTVKKHLNQIRCLLHGASCSHVNNSRYKLCVFSRREDVEALVTMTFLVMTHSIVFPIPIADINKSPSLPCSQEALPQRSVHSPVAIVGGLGRTRPSTVLALHIVKSFCSTCSCKILTLSAS